jgi:phosphoribosylamine--glycine ligase
MAAATTVVAAEGYPDKPRAGDAIALPPPERNVEIFHAGTAVDETRGTLITAGGRVLAVTAVAPGLIEAVERSRAYAEQVQFKGKQLRRDIGWRELTRGARAS